MSHFAEVFAIALPLQALLLAFFVIFMLAVSRLHNLANGSLRDKTIYWSVAFGLPLLGFVCFFKAFVFFAKRPWWIW